MCLSCQELGPYHVGTEAGGSLGKRNLHLNSSMASNGVTRADVSAIYSISGLVAGPDCCRGACSQDIGGSKGPSTHQILTPLYLSTERCSSKVGPTRPVEAKLNTVRCTVDSQLWSLLRLWGFSKRFLTYFNQFDKGVGARALGENQTLTGKAQELLSGATTQARGVDEQKGYSKIAHEVGSCLHLHRMNTISADN